MLLVVSEKEAYAPEVLEDVFGKIIKTHTSEIYVLIQHNTTTDSSTTISSFIDQISNIYVQSSKVNTKCGLQTSVNVLIEDETYDGDLASELWSSIYYTPDVVIGSVREEFTHHVTQDNIHYVNVEKSSLNSCHEGDKPQISNPKSTFEEIPVVAVGGTFDHLHDGHKILLSASAFLAGRKLIVGVTGFELLKNKKYLEYMESYEKRVDNVKSFLRHVRPSLIPDVYEINDICGPTAKIEDIDALVVSLESSKGADYVNNQRSKLGWKSLEVYTIGVVGSSNSTDFEHKLSSTNYRKLEYLKHHSDGKGV